MSTQQRYIVTEEQLPAIVRAAYDLSSPQGLGFLHARGGDLDSETVNMICEDRGQFGPRLYMDYVHGRSCKFSVRRDRDTGSLYILAPDWYDHSPKDLVDLAARCGLGEPVTVEVSELA